MEKNCISWAEAEELRPGCGAEWDVLMHRMGPPPVPNPLVLELVAANKGLYASIGPISVWYHPDMGWVKSFLAGSYDYEGNGLTYDDTHPRILEWWDRLPKAPWDRPGNSLL